MFYLNINVWRQTYIRLKNSNKCVLTLNVNMYISTHIFDSKIPGLQTHPLARHQVVSGVAPSRSCWFGLRFWSRRMAKHPGLTAILVPDSNTMDDRTPLWHNKQRQVGAGRPPARHQVVSGVALVVTEPTRNGGRTPKGHKPYTIQVVGRIWRSANLS